MPTADMTHLIEAAIRDCKVLRVTYRTVTNVEEELEIEPLAIRSRSGRRVLWCREVGADHVDDLIWDGIESAVATGNGFTRQPWTEPQ